MLSAIETPPGIMGSDDFRRPNNLNRERSQMMNLRKLTLLSADGLQEEHNILVYGQVISLYANMMHSHS